MTALAIGFIILLFGFLSLVCIGGLMETAQKYEEKKGEKDEKENVNL